MTLALCVVTTLYLLCACVLPVSSQQPDPTDVSIQQSVPTDASIVPQNSTQTKDVAENTNYNSISGIKRPEN